MKYDRILLKLSGESLQGIQKYGLSTDVLHSYAEQIKLLPPSTRMASRWISWAKP